MDQFPIPINQGHPPARGSKGGGANAAPRGSRCGKENARKKIIGCERPPLGPNPNKSYVCRVV